MIKLANKQATWTLTLYFLKMSASCYTLVASSSGSGSTEYPSAQELRSSLEKGSDEVKLETLRKIIVSTVNGVDQASTLQALALSDSSFAANTSHAHHPIYPALQV